METQKEQEKQARILRAKERMLKRKEDRINQAHVAQDQGFMTVDGVLYDDLLFIMTQQVEKLVFSSGAFCHPNHRDGAGKIMLSEESAKRWIAGLVYTFATASEIDDIYKKLSYMASVDEQWHSLNMD